MLLKEAAKLQSKKKEIHKVLIFFYMCQKQHKNAVYQFLPLDLKREWFPCHM